VEQPPTCGKGLAENAALPARLGGVTAAMADVLEVHLKALDLEDESSRLEHDAYTKLVDEHREAAAKLRAIADHMTGYRDLSMGAHDMSAMAGPEPLAAFDAFVARKQELLDLLQEQAGQDQQMLAQMRGASGGAR
jgi:hypothetical protein